MKNSIVIFLVFASFSLHAQYEVTHKLLMQNLENAPLNGGRLIGLNAAGGDIEYYLQSVNVDAQVLSTTSTGISLSGGTGGGGLVDFTSANPSFSISQTGGDLQFNFAETVSLVSEGLKLAAGALEMGGDTWSDHNPLIDDQRLNLGVSAMMFGNPTGKSDGSTYGYPVNIIQNSGGTSAPFLFMLDTNDGKGFGIDYTSGTGDEDLFSIYTDAPILQLESGSNALAKVIINESDPLHNDNVTVSNSATVEIYKSAPSGFSAFQVQPTNTIDRPTGLDLQEGYLIYDIDFHQYCYWDGTDWQKLKQVPKLKSFQFVNTTATTIIDMEADSPHGFQIEAGGVKEVYFNDVLQTGWTTSDSGDADNLHDILTLAVAIGNDVEIKIVHE